MRELDHEIGAQRWRGRSALVVGLIGWLILGVVAALIRRLEILPAGVLSDGLVVAAWVLLWLPLDTFIFTVPFHRADREVYRRTMAMRLTIRPKP
jgi:hypothetical protein